ncbi:hypothetical protein GQ457_01G042140 [Hibiscus cannabinus]
MVVVDKLAAWSVPWVEEGKLVAWVVLLGEEHKLEAWLVAVGKQVEALGDEGGGGGGSVGEQEELQAKCHGNEEAKPGAMSEQTLGSYRGGRAKGEEAKLRLQNPCFWLSYEERVEEERW